MSVHVGIYLHANYNYLAIIYEKDTRVYKRKLPNIPEVILAELESFKTLIPEL